MKRLKIMKAYAVLWLFIYFLVYSNFEYIKSFFFATLTFNLAVLTILIIGIIVIMKASINLVMLAGTFGTLAYKKRNLNFYLQGIEKIMPANIAHMFHARAQKGVLLFTAEESRAVIEWIDEKFSNQNRYINFFIGTVLMIGLLGTFSGLLISIDQMGRIILSLTGDIDLGKVIHDFSGPLSGMAVGFGSSLFGVIAAIILGIKGYILNKNQEVLIEGVEDWLKGRIIDNAPAAATPEQSQSTSSELPEHRSTFLDIFIDHISALTREMKHIAKTNEQLHSVFIASIQQARDEHEITLDVLHTINAGVDKLQLVAQTQTTTLQETSDSLAEAIRHNALLSASQIQEATQNSSETLLKALSDYRSETDKHNARLIDTLLKIQSTLQTDTTQIDETIRNTTQTLKQTFQDETKHLLKTLTDYDNAMQSRFDALVQATRQNASQLRDTLLPHAEEIAHILRTIAESSQTIRTVETLLSDLEQTAKNQETTARELQTLLEQINTRLQEELTKIDELLGLEDLHFQSTQTQTLMLRENAQNEAKRHETIEALLTRQQEALNALVQKHEETLRSLRDVRHEQENNRQTKHGLFSKFFD